MGKADPYQPGTEQGSAMVAALLTIVVLLLLGASALNLAHLEKMIARRYVEYLQASYLAESGIETARAAMFNNPGMLISSETTFQIEIDRPDLAGEAVVVITRPSNNGLLTVKSTGQMSGGAKRIWQATMTAPPDYEVYCDEVRLNPEVNITGLLQKFGILYPNPIPPLLGDLGVDPRCQGAYQEFAGDGGYFSSANHTHRYQPPGPVDINFWRKAAGSPAIDWGPYSYRFVAHDVMLLPTLENSIYGVNGDVLIYSADGHVDLQNCMIIATGDIWIVNLGDISSRITGLYLAGRDITLYQSSNDMEVKANLCAGRDVNICCGGAGNHVYLQHVEDQGVIKGAPLALRGKLGFLSIRSYQEMAI
ncbi:MAG: hypothetical protein ACM3UW_07870 [Bacillota bacterium]